MSYKIYKQALEIRQVENKFLDLFSKGELNGTVHTCVGQEMSALAFAGQLEKTDFVFSNHRCHGHYIAFTGDVRGLIAELMGKQTGTCGGIGSSQHLYKKNFFSNGIQGGIIPVAAGFALANKLKDNQAIGIVYIGDGTLGEGVVYETMNILSKWEIPLLIVCENNYYAQSTPVSFNLAGDIIARPESFGIKSFHSNTWDFDDLMQKARESINYVRENKKPVFHLVDTYRLNAHSKGDDDRDSNEIEKYIAEDPISRFAKEDPESYSALLKSIDKKIESYVESIKTDNELSVGDYFQKYVSEDDTVWKDVESNENRQVKLINSFFKEKMNKYETVLFIGEDVNSPYGGAFKVAQGLSESFPLQTFSTPISEAAIVGIGNGLALAGMKPYVEIMFGDFITLAMDQIVNHASKFYHMYNKQVNCPIVIRTPVGARRGYGPTHSQSLEKFLIGIDNIKLIALNVFISPKYVYDNVNNETHPVIVIENKTDYGKKINTRKKHNYSYLKTEHNYPTVKITPAVSQPTLTIVAYGGMASYVENILHDIFIESELITELIVPTKIYPMDYAPIIKSVEKTRRLLVVEESSVSGGFGSEVVAYIAENAKHNIKCSRIGALPVPIPSVKSLESVVLPNKNYIIKQIKLTFF